MKETSYFTRAIKTPRYLLRRNFLIHPLTSISSVRRIMKSNSTLFESVSRLTGEKIENLENYFASISDNVDLQKHLDEQFKKLDSHLVNEKLKQTRYSRDNPAGRINMNSQENVGFFLYMIIRSLRPDVVVETGVSSGESSTYILQGLEDNKKGKLFSIDLPPEAKREKQDYIFPTGETSGWAIPHHLRSRWELTLGSSKEMLLPLLQRLKSIDVFLHDSLHTYEHMMYEFQTSWDFLRKSGLLISDDIQTLDESGHSPFLDFADIKQEKITVFNLIGGFRKS